MMAPSSGVRGRAPADRAHGRPRRVRRCGRVHGRVR